LDNHTSKIKLIFVKTKYFMKNLLKIIAIACLLAVICISCLTTGKVIDYSNKHPEVKELICGQQRPDTIRIPGKTITHIDTVLAETEDNSFFLWCQTQELQYSLDSALKLLKVKPVKIIVTKNTTDTLIIPDLVAQQKAEAIGFSKGVQSVKPTTTIVKVGRWWIASFFILLGLVIAYIIGRWVKK